ncbi:MAG: TonB-dependent receptor, partial [Bacteroidota bacterium]
MRGHFYILSFVNIITRVIALSICIFSYSISVAAQQNLLDKEIEVSARMTTIETFIKILEKKGGFTFSYSNNINVRKKIMIYPKKRTVKQFLDEIFPNGTVNYIEKGNKIILVPSKSGTSKQNQKQLIIGRVIDKDTKSPLIGVNIVICSENPIKGASTDDKGFFRINSVPIGRHDILLKYVGYKDRIVHNVLLVSAKVLNLDIEMEQSFYNINEVIVHPDPSRAKPVNDLSVISARSFNADEVTYFPGSINDVSRAAVSFPGVISNNDGQNHIIIRGNSPKGLQWKIEGIEVPNLNHFAEVGASGGGVSILSNNMFSHSDFLTGAFPAEYGNALSGVFDLRLRSGNNEKHERSFQIGLIGTELMLEGPIKKGTNATYIGHYRYTTLKLAQELGAPIKNLPVFQDLSFKLFLPTNKFGTFSVFGIGGISNEVVEYEYDWTSDMGVIGVSNVYNINSKTFIKSIIAFSGWKYTWDSEKNIATSENPIDYKVHNDITEYSPKATFCINRAFNIKHKIKLGLVYDFTLNNTHMGWYSDTLYNMASNPEHPDYSSNIIYEHVYSDTSGNTATLQAFVNWKYRVNKKITVNSGIHFLKYFLNSHYYIEPRLALYWQFFPKHSISAAFGVHSRKESFTLYTGTKKLYDGAKIHPNIDLELTKAQHYVLGYNFYITNDLRANIEAYYQHLYDIPVYPFPPYFSTINMDYGFEGNILINRGTGYNKGVELLVEKFFSNGYYFMVNGTLYESKYKNYLGDEFDTRYNGLYAANGILRKEFKVGKSRQHWLGISARLIYTGG